MKFKNIITALFVMLTAFIGYSCTEDADVAALETELSLSSTYFGPTQEGGEQMVSISSNAEWTISQSADTDWMAIDTTSGSNNGDFTITVDPNLTVLSREVTLVVTSGDVSEIVLVSQEMGDEKLTVEPVDQLSTSRSAKEDISFVVTANTIWDASVSYEAGDEEWVTLATQTGSGETEVGVTVTENPLVTDRTATISFLTASNTTYTYKIVQSYGDATIEIAELATFDGWESSKWVTITSNNGWSVDTPANDWVTIATSTGSSTVTGNGNGTFQVTVSDNPTAKQRETTLYVDYGAESGEKAEVAVVQNGAVSTISVADPQYADFDSTGGSVTFDVTSNDTWVVTNLPSTCSVVYYAEGGSVTTSGEYNGSFKITATSNAGDAISQNIVITCDEDDTKFVNIPVTQTSAAEDAKLSVSISGNEDVAAAGTSLTVTITGSEAWEAAVDDDYTAYYDANFLTLGATSGSAATNLSVTVEKNNNQDARVGTVTITSASGVTRKVSVSQLAGAPAFTSTTGYDSKSNPIPAAGGVYTLEVTTNANYWFTEHWISWLTVSEGEHSYDEDLTLNIEENMTFSDRSGTIYIKNVTGYSSNKNYIVYQAASTGSLSLSEVDKNASFNTATDVVAIENTGGSIEVKVKSNVDYDISYEYDSDEYKDFISCTTSYDDGADYTEVLKFAVAESENYEAATEVNTLVDTGYIVIKPTSQAETDHAGVNGVEIEIKVTLGAFMAQEPTYTVSKESSTTLKVEIDNTKFKEDPSFATSDFEVSYVNDYAGSTVKNGTLAVSAVAWDSANPTYVTLTTATMYNTDEVTVEYVGSNNITLANTKTFDFDEMTVDPDYEEFVNEDFESETAGAGWTLFDSSYSVPFAGTYDFAEEDSDGNKYMSINIGERTGTGGVYVRSNQFEQTEAGVDFTLTYVYRIPTGVPGPSEQRAFVATTADGAFLQANSSWSSSGKWIGSVESGTGEWISVSQSFTSELSNDERTYDDVVVTYRLLYQADAVIHIDNVVFGNAVARTE